MDFTTKVTGMTDISNWFEENPHRLQDYRAFILRDGLQDLSARPQEDRRSLYPPSMLGPCGIFQQNVIDISCLMPHETTHIHSSAHHYYTRHFVDANGDQAPYECT